MRSYPRNSPQAAARIVGLSLLADGHLSRVEMDALTQLDPQPGFGLVDAEWHALLRELCEDLLATAACSWGAGGNTVQASQLTQLLAEVDDPWLRARVVDACVRVAEADAHVSEGEAALLLALLGHWGNSLNLGAGPPPATEPQTH